MKSQTKKTHVKKPRPVKVLSDDQLKALEPKVTDTLDTDDTVIDLSGYGAAESTMISGISSLDTITITAGGAGYASGITYPTYSTAGVTVGGLTNSSSWNGTSGGSYYTISGAGGGAIGASNNVNIGTNGIDLKEGADVKIDGKSLKDFMTKMEQRMAILVPDPVKLEKFEALKKAYEHYKTMESLCFDEPEEDKE